LDPDSIPTTLEQSETVNRIMSLQVASLVGLRKPDSVVMPDCVNEGRIQ